MPSNAKSRTFYSWCLYADFQGNFTVQTNSIIAVVHGSVTGETETTSRGEYPLEQFVFYEFMTVQRRRGRGKSYSVPVANYHYCFVVPSIHRTLLKIATQTIVINGQFVTGRSLTRVITIPVIGGHRFNNASVVSYRRRRGSMTDITRGSSWYTITYNAIDRVLYRTCV